MRTTARAAVAALAIGFCAVGGSRASAQSFGVELRNTLMPASGGMAGTSLARPQDLLSGINGNAATLTQYHGTQFVVSGAWAETTMNIVQTGNAPFVGVTPFSAKSETPGAAAPNIGVTQELDAYGMPLTVGLAFLTAAGGGTSFRKVPQSNGTSTYLVLLEFAPSVAARLTDRLSIGSTMFVGSGYLDGPFVGDGAMTNAYALRGSVGLSYELTDTTTLGLYYESSQKYRFDDAVRIELSPGVFDVSRDVLLELPNNFGFGVANTSLMDGRLLLAVDVLYLNWSTAKLFEDIYRNQWVVQCGTQYAINPRCKLRLGYAYAQNPVNPNTGSSVDGIPIPGGIPGVKYLQAQFAVLCPHRFSAGVGVSDILPGLDFDAFAGGMFEASEQLGGFTNVSLQSYWIGAGFTWRFGRGCPCAVAVN